MTVRIWLSDPLDPQERFELLESVSDTLALYGKRPASIRLVNVTGAGAVASS